MPDARPHDETASAAPFSLIWAESGPAAFTVAPDRRAARRPSLACRWTHDRANRRLVSIWVRRRAEIAVGALAISPDPSAPAGA
jgi:hypothetical protein